MTKNKTRNKKNDINSLNKNLKTRWDQKRPVLFFVLGFCLFMFLFYLFWQSEFFNLKIQPIIVSINALVSSAFLNILGQDTSANKDLISSPLISISIARGCDAVEAMALFLSTTLAFPMSWKKKLLGALSGLIILFIINVIRIISLYFIGIKNPAIFETMHTQVWPIIIIILATILWITLIRFKKINTVYAKK